MTRRSRQNSEDEGICEFDYALYLLRFFVRFKKILSLHRRCRENNRNSFHRGPQSWKFADENLVFDCKFFVKKNMIEKYFMIFSLLIFIFIKDYK